MRPPSATRPRTLLVLALALLCALPTPSASELTLDPVRNRARVVLSEIYDVSAWALRVPYDLAFPLVARARLGDYVDSLPLDKDVRARVHERIDSREFVDEIVPFLIAVKQMYLSGDEAPRDFDTHLRAAFEAREDIAGFEHSMFRWAGVEEPDGTPAVAFFSDELAASLVSLYDALYEDGESEFLGSSLSCGSTVARKDLPATVRRAEPVVREILGQVASRMDPGSELEAGVTSVLGDDERLEAVSVTLVRFIDELVCKYYRVFATRVMREDQLRRWMLAELEREGGGRLWDFVVDAQINRRHAVLVVVDGLQGNLLESLAGGSADSPFIQAIAAEHARAASFAPATQASRPAPAQNTLFLESFAREGLRDERYLPFFRSLYGGAGNEVASRHYAIARVGISTTPTISVRNLPIAKTGAPVAGEGGSGIPNFHFVDRDRWRDGDPDGRAYYFFGNDALMLNELTREAGMRSLFERLPELSSFSCAAQYDAAAHYSVDALINLALGEKLRDFAERLCMGELARRVENERDLRVLRKELLAYGDSIRKPLRWFQFYRRSGRRDARTLLQPHMGWFCMHVCRTH